MYTHCKEETFREGGENGSAELGVLSGRLIRAKLDTMSVDSAAWILFRIAESGW